MTTLAIAGRPPRQHITYALPNETPRELPSLVDLELDRQNAAVWMSLVPSAPKHVSRQLLAEFSAISARVANGNYGTVRYKVLLSRIAGTFSLGGDLELFLNLIRTQDRIGLANYARAAINEIWANMTGCGKDGLTTIALVSGEAQGGGVEAALSCHLIVAEQGTYFGFPESLFGLYPGMGAIPLLAARTDSAVAARLTATANRYGPDFLHDIGVVDFVVPVGAGREFVKSLIACSPMDLIRRRKMQLSRITFKELLESVDHWVSEALALSDKHKRAMTYLLSAQRARSGASLNRASRLLPRG
jgi:DSF synthase